MTASNLSALAKMLADDLSEDHTVAGTLHSEEKGEWIHVTDANGRLVFLGSKACVERILKMDVYK